MKNHLIAMIIAALPAYAMATTLPAGTSPEQARQVQDWQLYSTACRGGLMDEANRDDTLGYCGVARYLMFRLGQSGLCTEDGRDWRACPPQGEDPLEGFPF
ncbi:hypothetical protein [Paracoccus sp. NSM]|uniref:hypothetical protein n=1 Tax=Paracoccus sp. NSM TaxID=3457784 RepID=UPI004036902B